MSAIQVFHTHAQMFGLVSAVQAGLSMLVGPKYSHEDFDAKYGVDTSAASNVEKQKGSAPIKAQSLKI